MVRETGERGRKRRLGVRRKMDPGRVMQSVLDPAAVLGLRSVEVGDAATCPGTSVERPKALAL